MSPRSNWRRETKPTWCPGCGNHAALEALVVVLDRLKVEPWRVVVVSGIGQAGKMPHYLRCNFLHGLHGRVLPMAMGVKLANPELKVFAIGGDGDIYGEGGGHLVHAFRRNLDITCLVHNNGVYGLTRGQASPSAPEDYRSSLAPDGTGLPPFNPMAVGLACGATFLSRAFVGDRDRFVELVLAAEAHRGFGFVDVLQPCVTYDRHHTFEWYRERVYDVRDEGHDAGNPEKALALALEWPSPADERVPVGILYREERDCHEDSVPVLKQGPLVGRRGVDEAALRGALREFL